MDTSTVYTLVLKLASNGGTVYALAAACTSALLALVVWRRIQEETRTNDERKQAKQDLETSLSTGNANGVRDAINRLRKLGLGL